MKLSNDKRTDSERLEDEKRRVKRELWKEWWTNIAPMTEERRNRALTRRCKICGKGSLDNVNVNFEYIEGICEVCYNN